MRVHFDHDATVLAIRIEGPNTECRQSGSIYVASNASIAGLGQGWKSVEYNLVGDCCAYGTYFIAGPATLNVRVVTVDGTQNAPTCLTSASGATAETNNLNLVRSCAVTGGAQPSIAFGESGGGPLPPGISQGDTHLITIGGTGHASGTQKFVSP